MTPAQIAAAVTERETGLAAIIAKYDLAPVALPPFYAWTARDIAVTLDKIEKKSA